MGQLRAGDGIVTQAVVRVGKTGPLHIAWLEPDGSYYSNCDRRLPRTVTRWRAGREATRVWRSLRRCARCEAYHQERTGKR